VGQSALSDLEETRRAASQLFFGIGARIGSNQQDREGKARERTGRRECRRGYHRMCCLHGPGGVFRFFLVLLLNLTIHGLLGAWVLLSCVSQHNRFSSLFSFFFSGIRGNFVFYFFLLFFKDISIFSFHFLSSLAVCFCCPFPSPALSPFGCLSWTGMEWLAVY
jgi:hypothetical protein